MYRCHCQLIPNEVLERLACDPALSKEICANAAYSAKLNDRIRAIRDQTRKLAGFVMENKNLSQLSDHPEVDVYDCKRTQSLPGVQVINPAESKDATVSRTYVETGHMATFLLDIFKRNSIDDAGMTLMSSVHYGKKYNNAMWNGLQMIYGDGDGELFLDFTLGTDVIAHELGHGITQYTLQLDYEDEPGGLNESLSDCFGSMFRQWRLKQDAASADWLIGKEVVGPVTRERGYTCLRDMSAPAGAHCLAPQPDHYKDLKVGQDPHYTSGPPNLAFCTACKQLGGNSWESIGKIWYQVMTTSGLVPRMGMKDFAEKTRKAATDLFGKDSPALAAVDAGWKKVGL